MIKLIYGFPTVGKSHAIARTISDVPLLDTDWFIVGHGGSFGDDPKNHLKFVVPILDNLEKSPYPYLIFTNLWQVCTADNTALAVLPTSTTAITRWQARDPAGAPRASEIVRWLEDARRALHSRGVPTLVLGPHQYLSDVLDRQLRQLFDPSSWARQSQTRRAHD